MDIFFPYLYIRYIDTYELMRCWELSNSKNIRYYKNPEKLWKNSHSLDFYDTRDWDLRQAILLTSIFITLKKTNS